MTLNLLKYLLVGKLILSACALQGDSSPPQNILVILADDMGWPGRIPPGLQRSEVAVTMDVLPTILDAVKLPVPENMEIHGDSLMPLLTGMDYSRTDAIHWETKHNLAVMRGDWKLVHQFWKEPELYNLKSDISESRDLSDQYPERVTEMVGLHAAWKSKYYPNPVARKTKRSKFQFPEAVSNNATKKPISDNE
ncbi:MAG: hypothetical protein HOI15_14810 [Opitutales bacterium]|nr:hypothetical protein [Opitutales bacterium]